jgi:[phosphatase 2A protein]-leucine-carboxy methyltransferase
MIPFRVSRLEMLDEIEELELVLEHYALTWGVWVPDSDIKDKTRWIKWSLSQAADDEDDSGEATETEA